jgi:hypothetical protein
MTTKKPKKLTGLTLADFLTNTNLSQPSKMPLLIDDIETDHYLMVIGAQSKQVTRSRLIWGTETNKLNEELKTIKDDIEKGMVRLEKESHLNNLFAVDLVVDWSFGDFNKEDFLNLLTENTGLANAVISHAFAKESTLAKK